MSPISQNVIGCVDCTHIKITMPTINEHEYVNRKNDHTINVQLICDCEALIMWSDQMPKAIPETCIYQFYPPVSTTDMKVAHIRHFLPEYTVQSKTVHIFSDTKNYGQAHSLYSTSPPDKESCTNYHPGPNVL